MDNTQIRRVADFIWTIADDVLRDVYVRGKYRDVILPMVVIRRLDTVLEPTKAAVLERNAWLDANGIVEKDPVLRQAAGQPFYNTSQFTLKSLRDQPKQMRANFEDYLNGFSPNVQDILDKFRFRNQIQTLVEADALGFLVEKFVDPSINLGPGPVLDANGEVKLAGLDNHGMGTVFEELIRRFNEENNEEAGEHFPPRDVVELMADLILLPIADAIESATYLVYDGACGTGGMLTVAADRLEAIAADHGKSVSIHLFGQEVNPETFAITTADLLLKGEGEEADNMRYGSTLSSDGFPNRQFDFMLSNPPYGKSWKKDLDLLGGKDNLIDRRFTATAADGEPLSLVTRTSDGQLLFLVNKLAKMKDDTPLGSRIAEVHNGSALFTGDAGQGESNIRRWILENDWLEAIVALPLNMFYNTGIATYIWVLSNKKSPERRGHVQLIDATSWKAPLRRNLGQKNAEVTAEDRARILYAFMTKEESEHSKIFPNDAFGYRKIVVERPLRLRARRDRFAAAVASTAGVIGLDAAPLRAAFDAAADALGAGDPAWSPFEDALRDELARLKTKPTAKGWAALRAALTERDETADPVERKVRAARADDQPGPGELLVLRNGKRQIITLEPDPDLRDTEQVPLREPGGIVGFLEREVLPYAPDAWVDEAKTQIGYEISFTRHFYKPTPMRSLAEIRSDIEALERETSGLLEDVLKANVP